MHGLLVGLIKNLPPTQNIPTGTLTWTSEWKVWSNKFWRNWLNPKSYCGCVFKTGFGSPSVERVHPPRTREGQEGRWGEWATRSNHQRLVGLGVWFSLRVREVPGSNPGRARKTFFRFDSFPSVKTRNTNMNQSKYTIKYKSLQEHVRQSVCYTS